MSFRALPKNVQVHLVLWWAGMIVAGLGVLGFILSFNEVAGPSRWATDVSTDIPWFAYISIFMWAGGGLLAWYSRHRVNAAVRKRKAELADAARVDVD
ncbi:MAG: hypothetical protein ABFC80_01930 [Coriobacteriales bacterium]|nr:hypothetical protein [Actinomycetes bacterium]